MTRLTATVKNVTRAQLVAFMRNRAEGVPDGQMGGAGIMPAFKPGVRSSKHAFVEVETTRQNSRKVDDKYGHGQYTMFDSRYVTRVVVTTKTEKSTMTATRDSEGATFTVVLETSIGNPVSVPDDKFHIWWRGQFRIAWDELPSGEEPATEPPTEPAATTSSANPLAEATGLDARLTGATSG